MDEMDPALAEGGQERKGGSGVKDWNEEFNGPSALGTRALSWRKVASTAHVTAKKQQNYIDFSAE